MRQRTVLLTLATLGFCGMTAEAIGLSSATAPGGETISPEIVQAQVEAKFAIDRAKCTALAGYERDSCIVAAHATRSKTRMAFRLVA